MLVLEDKLKDKQILNSLMSNEKFVETRENLVEQLEGVKAEIENLHRTPIHPDKLAGLNFLLGLKSGLERAIVLFTSLQEELESM